MNLLLEAGISRSLFRRAAKIPNKKNSRVGLVKLLIRMVNSILRCVLESSAKFGSVLIKKYLSLLSKT